MTIDLRITKGRFDHTIQALTDAGTKWVRDTFDFSFVRNKKDGTTMFSGEDSDFRDVVKKAEAAGLNVEER